MLGRVDQPQSQEQRVVSTPARQVLQLGQRDNGRPLKREREIAEALEAEDDEFDQPYTDRQSNAKVSRVTTDAMVAEMVQQQLREMGYGAINVQQVQSSQPQLQTQHQAKPHHVQFSTNAQQIHPQQTHQQTHPLVPPQSQQIGAAPPVTFPQYPQAMVAPQSHQIGAAPPVTFTQYPQSCAVCLSPMHLTGQCTDGQVFCSKCGKTGHLAGQCRSNWFCTRCHMLGHDISICRRPPVDNMHGRGAAPAGRGDSRGRGRGRGQPFQTDTTSKSNRSCWSCGGLGHMAWECPQNMAAGGRGQGRGRDSHFQNTTGSNAVPIIKQEPGTYGYHVVAGQPRPLFQQMGQFAQPVQGTHQLVPVAQQRFNMPVQQQYFQVPGQHQVQLPPPPPHPGFIQGQQQPHVLTVQQVQTGGQDVAEMNGERSGETPTSHGGN